MCPVVADDCDVATKAGVVWKRDVQLRSNDSARVGSLSQNVSGCCNRLNTMQPDHCPYAAIRVGYWFWIEERLPRFCMGYLKLDSGMGGLAISRLDQPASKCTYYPPRFIQSVVAYINEH